MKKNDVVRLNDAVRDITELNTSPLMAYVFLVINYDFDPKVFPNPHIEFLDVIDQSKPVVDSTQVSELFEMIRTIGNCSDGRTHCAIIMPHVFQGRDAICEFKTVRETLAELKGMIYGTEHCFQLSEDTMFG